MSCNCNRNCLRPNGRMQDLYVFSQIYVSGMQDALVDGSLACHFFFSSVSSDVLEAPAPAKGYTPKVNSLRGGFHRLAHMQPTTKIIPFHCL